MDLKKSVKVRQLKSIDDLWTATEAGWANIPSAKIDALFKSMCKRVGAVIGAKGGKMVIPTIEDIYMLFGFISISRPN